MGPQTRSGQFGEEKIPPPLQLGIESRFLGRPVRSDGALPEFQEHYLLGIQQAFTIEDKKIIMHRKLSRSVLRIARNTCCGKMQSF